MPGIAQSCPEVAANTFDYIKQNPYATIKEISEVLKISERSAKNHIALLRGTFIQRSGSDTKGHWIIKWMLKRVQHDSVGVQYDGLASSAGR